MKFNAAFRTFGFCNIALTAIVTWASVASADEPWRVLLQQQLLAEEKCEVTLLSDLAVKQEDKGVHVIAKAHCQDNRSFDVVLQPGGTKYEISACAPTYC